MKQPDNELEIFSDCIDGVQWVDVRCGGDHGGFCNVAMSVANSEQAAWRQAARRLRKLANEAEKKADRLKYGEAA